MVVPFHAPNFKRICDKCVGNADGCSVSELAYLFLRVKCTRPMTFQYITLQMVEVARISGGFIDQTEFKTAATYTFGTLIISEEVIKVLYCYIFHVRPLLNPVCNYLLVSTVGKQCPSFTTAMTLLVKEDIGKYINPTRYRPDAYRTRDYIGRSKAQLRRSKTFLPPGIYQEISPQEGRCAPKKWLEIVEHTRESSFLICCPRSIAIICCSINR